MKNNKSFVRSCLIQNTIFLVIILILYIAITTISNYQLDISFPTIYNLLEFEDVLETEEFSRIPLRLFKHCSIIIYDNNGKTLYSTDKEIEEGLEISDLAYINSYANNDFFRVFDFINEENSPEYYIMKININDDGTENLEAFAVLNNNLEVIMGDLFGEKTKLSDYEFGLIRGKYKESDIEKYNYTNIDDEERTVIFISPEFNIDNYDKVVSATNKLWLVTIPIIIAVILLQISLYKKKLQKCTEPLNNIISFYENRENEKTHEDDIPKEFVPFANNFKMLLKKIDRNKEDKNKMIANISHDLKTPLTAIQGYAQAFKDGIVPEDKKEQYINSIYDKTVVATDLINKLFEYTKLEHPKYNLKLEETDMVDFTNKYLDKKVSEIELKGYAIERDLSREECICNIDKELFVRLYDNLISNAINHNKPGTKILFRISNEKEKTKIIIADNGVGIPESIKETLFEPFVIADEARTQGDGTGLGMSIVRTIIELHNGKIMLNEDNIIKGYKTKFDIELRKINK